MKLGVQERLILLGVLPQEGDFVTLKIVRQLQSDLSFSEEEIKRYNFKEDKKRIHWDNEDKQGKEIEIGDKAKEIIATALKKLNDTKELKMSQLSLYEKFVNGGA